MSKKKKKHKHSITPVMYYASSFIDDATWDKLCEMAHKGVIFYVQSGKPGSPPNCGPGGCP